MKQVTYRKAQDNTVGLGLEICISNIPNLIETPLSFPCQLRLGE